MWTVCDTWIDIWTCIGRVRPAAHLLAARMGQDSLEKLIPTSQEEQTSETIPIEEAIVLLLRHSGMESCRLTPGKDFGTPVVHSLSLSFLTHCCDILEHCIARDQYENALANVITLQVGVAMGGAKFSECSYFIDYYCRQCFRVIYHQVNIQ